MKVKLGSYVKDTVSGFTGIAVACHSYLNGCNRISIQPCVDKDGKLPEDKAFDEPQLKVLPKKKLTGDNSTGGPEKFSDSRSH